MKYVLKWGIWRYTLISRDTGEPQEFDTREEAIKYLESREKDFKNIGYAIWFANLYHGDEKEHLR